MNWLLCCIALIAPLGCHPSGSPKRDAAPVRLGRRQARRVSRPASRDLAGDFEFTLSTSAPRNGYRRRLRIVGDLDGGRVIDQENTQRDTHDGAGWTARSGSMSKEDVRDLMQTMERSKWWNLDDVEIPRAREGDSVPVLIGLRIGRITRAFSVLGGCTSGPCPELIVENALRHAAGCAIEECAKPSR